MFTFTIHPIIHNKALDSYSNLKSNLQFEFYSYYSYITSKKKIYTTFDTLKDVLMMIVYNPINNA